MKELFQRGGRAKGANKRCGDTGTNAAGPAERWQQLELWKPTVIARDLGPNPGKSRKEIL